MNNSSKAYAYAISAVLMWATVATAFKVSLRYLDPLGLLLYASVVSCGVLFFILLLQGKLYQIKTCSKKELLYSALLGLLNPFLYYVILFRAYSLLPAQQAQPINMTWPIVLVLLSIPILKQKIGLLSIFAIFVSFFGVYILSTEGEVLGLSFTSLTGALLALASTVFWSLFWILNLRDKRDEVVKLFLNFAFGSVFIAVPALIFSDFDLSDMRGLICGVYVGLFEMGITFVLWLKALQYSRTTAQVSNLIYISPFISLIPIHFIVGEDIHPASVIGLVFIVAGVLIQRYDSRRMLVDPDKRRN